MRTWCNHTVRRVVPVRACAVPVMPPVMRHLPARRATVGSSALCHQPSAMSNHTPATSAVVAHAASRGAAGCSPVWAPHRAARLATAIWRLLAVAS
jgi:hypothetical protein